MNAILVQAAANLEAKGWNVTWDEKAAFFKAVHGSFSNGEIVVSVIDDKLFVEPM